MSDHSFSSSAKSKILGLSICAILSVPLVGNAASVNLATAPLANATTTQVLPNIMFTLDDSGSMGWDFMPDWVGNDYPRSTNTALYKNAAFNVTYYNPAIRYEPPAMFSATGSQDLTTYPSKTSGWDAVRYDAFGKQGNDVVSYPDQLCPNGTTPTGTSPNQKCNLVGGADYYTFVGGGYCTRPELKTCIPAASRVWCKNSDFTDCQATKTSVYQYTEHPFDGSLRWCSDPALTTCQATKTDTYQYPRYPGLPATATLTVGGSKGGTTVSSVKVNGLQILSGTTASSDKTSTIAQYIRDEINACTAAITGSCTVSGYSATSSGSVVTIKAPAGSGTITYTPVITKAGTRTVTPSAFSGGVPGSAVFTNIVSTNNSYPYPGTTAKHPNRTDCTSGTVCNYNEEMTNFANWFTYYHTRMQMMKSGVSRSFKSVSDKFRVGFNSISYTGTDDGSRFLHIDRFEKTHKNFWYTKLFGSVPASGTPLRNSLSKVGRIFANKASGQATKTPRDPVQYSCQQNFSILSTDGYWNTPSDNSSGNLLHSLTSGSVGNMDGGTTDRPMFEGPSASNDSLADIAKYYYDTDLRRSDLLNCDGGPVCPGGASTGCVTPDYFSVCDNNVFVSSTDNKLEQHMTSFTIGLGADGTLNYQSDYLTATSGDFQDLKNGNNNKNWPNPISNSGAERIDDLWHAAVNGQGQYFSAKNPNDIVSGLNTALASISSKVGAGAAAATSTLNPITGDNGVFVASYTTVKWTGNLEKRLMNLDTGSTSEQAVWCVEDIPADTCSAPSAYQNDTSNGSSVWYCVTPSSDLAACNDLGGTLVGTDCKVEVNKACDGTLKSKVAAASDTRTIRMKNGGALVEFNASNIAAAGLGSNFQKTFLTSNLSQAALMSPEQDLNLTADNLVNFLRGQTGNEDKASNAADNRIFRYREATMGDAVESQPAYISKPPFMYADPGYGTFSSSNSTRQKAVFLGANDGMLHAFNAENGQELWAYVPSQVIPNMYKLADKNYSTQHAYYVNGNAIVADADFGGGDWHTILVGSLRGGGRGYYALDVTYPANPSLLWEFTPSQDADIGYSFGDAIVTKLPGGKWVVLVASGYNNTGNGYLYILDPKDGSILYKIATPGSGGTATTPSGLAKIAAWADNSEKDNTALWVYGGDLLGNVWRFNLTDKSVMKFAELKHGGNAQPITTRPELAKINDKRVVYIATGKYLEVSDLTTNQQQTFYAIKDDDATTTFVDPRSSSSGSNKMVQQLLTTSGATRVIKESDCQTLNFVTDRGFFIDFPPAAAGEKASGTERANIDPQLQFGTLLIPTTVPSNDVCSPGGYGWMNFVNYKSGCMVKDATSAGQKTNSPIVGFNVVTLPSKDGVSINDRIKVSAVTADNPTPQLIKGAKFNASQGKFIGKRAVWRELVR